MPICLVYSPRRLHEGCRSWELVGLEGEERKAFPFWRRTKGQQQAGVQIHGSRLHGTPPPPRPARPALVILHTFPGAGHRQVLTHLWAFIPAIYYLFGKETPSLVLTAHRRYQSMSLGLGTPELRELNCFHRIMGHNETFKQGVLRDYYFPFFLKKECPDWNVEMDRGEQGLEARF